MIKLNSIVNRTLLVVVLSAVSQAEGVNATYYTYRSLQQSLIHAINAAKKRVIIRTPYFSDPAVARQLMVAKFKRLETKVILRHDSAFTYASQGRFFIREKIPLAVIPVAAWVEGQESFRTEVLVDDVFYLVSSDINLSTNEGRFSIINPSDKDRIGSFLEEVQSQFQSHGIQTENQAPPPSVLFSTPQTYDYDRITQPKKFQGKGYGDLPQSLPQIPAYLKNKR